MNVNIGYLSFISDVSEFLPWARAHLERRDAAVPQRFEPAIRGLELAASGRTSSDVAFAEGGRVFTGWSTDRHLLAPVHA
jgi:hypothetical protein